MPVVPAEIILDGAQHLLVGVIDPVVLEGTVAEEVHPLVVFLDEEDAVVVLVIRHPVLCQDVKTPFEVGIFPRL